MKKLGRWRLVAATVFFLACLLGVSPAKAQVSVSLQVFYDELQPYGTWMQHANYGYVWMPRVDRGFSPYATNGYWINTEYGNTWVSDYSWGWAPFHYGRWFYDDFYGWMWVPDTTWGPAWVAWRSGGGYYGWAPLMPGFGFSVSFNYYSSMPNYYWNFVPYRYITYHSVYRHCVPRPHVVNIINNTTIITNNYTDNRRRTYITGPSRREIERTTRERVDVYSISDRNAPGRTEIERGRVSLYKPEIDNSRETRINSMPSRFMRDDGRGKLEQVEARRDRTSESYKSRSLENDLQRREQREQPGSIEQMERNQRLDIQRENDAFQRFERQRETPAREQERFNSPDVRKKDLNRNQQMNRNNEEMLRQQRDVQPERENSFRDLQRNRNDELQMQQQRRQNDVLEQQRNVQRQRENNIREQRNNDASRRQQFERQTPQRDQFSQPGEIRRTPEKQPQNLQRMERPNQNRFSQPNNNFERQRSGGQGEIKRSSGEQRSISPGRSHGGGSSSSSRRHN
jgi:Family of unknown function (DUF6600)